MALGSRGKNVELRDQDLCNSPILTRCTGCTVQAYAEPKPVRKNSKLHWTAQFIGQTELHCRKNWFFSNWTELHGKLQLQFKLSAACQFELQTKKYQRWNKIETQNRNTYELKWNCLNEKSDVCIPLQAQQIVHFFGRQAGSSVVYHESIIAE